MNELATEYGHKDRKQETENFQEKGNHAHKMQIL